MVVLAVVKFGGSFISEKSRKFSVRKRAVQAAFQALSNTRFVLVHGGGSFGHPVASEYGLSGMNTSTSRKGVWETRSAMQRLNDIICQAMAKSGLKPYVVPGVAILDTELRVRPGIKDTLDIISNSGLTPVSYGDVLPVVGGFRIVSGDYLSLTLCSLMQPRRMVFVLDKPGILKDPQDDESLVRRVEPDELESFGHGGSHDVTGGFKYKLKIAKEIAGLGVETAFVSGFNGDALIKSVLGGPFKGTLVVSKK
ncbi:MAG: hypothetical protein JRN68_09935 [Nitrososphaerota archaeon]|jgi:isopentenyl phosphate kinase|nr:hypothetical protein [Nitrososphaerota archaeon]